MTVRATVEVNPGDMYGSWRVIEEMPAKVWLNKLNRRCMQRMVKCICTECGETIKVLPLSSLRSGITSRCRPCGDKVRSRKCIAAKRQIPMLVAATLNSVQHLTEEQLNTLFDGASAEIKRREGARGVSNGH